MNFQACVPEAKKNSKPPNNWSCQIEETKTHSKCFHAEKETKQQIVVFDLDS